MSRAGDEPLFTERAAVACGWLDPAAVEQLRAERDAAQAEVVRLTDAAVIVQCEHPEMDAVLAERDALLPAIRCLFAVYEAWWHKVGTVDPGDELARAGYAALLTSDDDQLMETVCLAVERYEALIHLALQRTEGAQP